MSLPTDEDLCTIRLPDQITDRGTQNKMVNFALAIDNMRRKLHSGLTDLGSVKIDWNCGIESNLKGTMISWPDILKPNGVVLLPGPRFLNLLLTIEAFWERKENACQKRDTKRKLFNWNDLLELSAKDSTYTLSSSTDTVREGESFTVTLTADNVDAGVAIGYNITGIDSAVISRARKYGDITVGESQVLSYTVAHGTITSNKTFNFILSPADTVGTLTSSPSLSVTFTNIEEPEYSLSGPDNIIEHGEEFNVVITIDEFVSGSTVGYQFSGVDASEVEASSDSGMISIASDTYTLTYTNSINANDATMTFTLDSTDSNGYGTGEPSIEINLRASLLDPE